MKILICTIESWNSKVGANTFETLFSDYQPSDLANVYIREENPDSKCCSRYFHISEMKVIRSVFRGSLKTGCEVCVTGDGDADNLELKQSKDLYNRNRKKRSYVKLLARELLWWLSKWKSEELNRFLDDFKPDLVVFGMEGYLHFNRICRYIIRYTNAKSIGYFWDDNFTYKQMPNNSGFKIFRFFQRKSLKKLASETDAFWAITDKTKKEADAFFGIDCRVMTKPIDYSDKDSWNGYELHKPVRMLYTGNLLIGRFDVLKLISQALDKINSNKLLIELDVYTGSYISSEDIKSLGEYVHMMGTVSQNEVIELQSQADILLFIEAITGDMSEKARLSFSTKLTDYFKSGKCIFAIGANDIAPVEYLHEQDAAVCATNEADIYMSLNKLVSQPELINQYGKKAFMCGYTNHSKDKIRAIRDSTIRNLEVEHENSAD